MDGEMAASIAQSDFPKAQRVEVPQLSEITTMLLNVQQKNLNGGENGQRRAGEKYHTRFIG